MVRKWLKNQFQTQGEQIAIILYVDVYKSAPLNLTTVYLLHKF